MESLENSVLMMAGVNLDFDLTFIIQLAIVLVLMIVLKTFVFDTYLETIDERDKKTDQTRDEADAVRGEAEAISQKFEDAMATARAEANKIRQTLRLEGVAFKEESVGKARQEAQAHLNEKQAALDAEVGTARSQIESQIDEISKLVVTKIIGRGV